MPDSNATINRTELVTRSFRRIGIQYPSTEELADGVVTLNLLVKQLESKGRFLHAVSNTPYSLTTVASQQSYATGTTATEIPSYIMALERVELVVGSAPYRPLDILDRSGFQQHADRDTAAAEPVAVHFDKAASPSSNKLWFLPAPNAAYTAKLFYRRRLYDFDLSTDNPDVPIESALDLIDILAARLAPEYVGVEKSIQFHEPMAQEAKKSLRAANREEATTKPLRTEYF